MSTAVFEEAIRQFADALVSDITARVVARADAMTKSGGRWMTTNEAAEYLGVSPITLEIRRVEKHGPPYSKMGRNIVRYWSADLDHFMRDGDFNTPSRKLTPADVPTPPNVAAKTKVRAKRR